MLYPTTTLLTLFHLIFSVAHPFLGDYVRLRHNSQWRKLSIDSSDQYVVFADIINKIARSSGKVSFLQKKKRKIKIDRVNFKFPYSLFLFC